MKIILSNPLNEDFKEVEVKVGDFVEITEWDGIVAQGYINKISEATISLENGMFLEGL